MSLKVAGGLFEIISADSVQVYRYMDIGSSKPSPAEMGLVKHYLIDIVEPDYRFTAGDYCKRAADALEEVQRNDKIPLIVGGTGFYIDSLFGGIDKIPEIDEQVRETVASEYDNEPELLFNELKNVDPEFASKVHLNDRQRIIRGISVYRYTGNPISSYFNIDGKNKISDSLFLGLYIDRVDLIDRIDKRVDLMIKKGLVDEVIKLRAMGYAPALNSMQSIGYSEINKYIDGIISLEDAIIDIKKNTKKYAKKQMTWFKKNKSIIWLNQDDIAKAPLIIKKWLDRS